VADEDQTTRGAGGSTGVEDAVALARAEAAERALDADVVRRMTVGDNGALAALFDRHGGRVLGLLARMLGAGGEAEEVLQDVFLQAWTRATAYSAEKGSVRAWLLVIARSRALDRIRALRASRRRDEDALAEQPLVEEPEAESRLERHDLGVQMRRLLGELPSEQREAIELAFFGGLTHTEVAERLRVPLGTVKSRILMGMKKLKAGLGPYR
jgi:RNA polymerase sigma-70 factor, ECF subfamily